MMLNDSDIVVHPESANETTATAVKLDFFIFTVILKIASPGLPRQLLLRLWALTPVWTAPRPDAYLGPVTHQR